MQKLWWISWVVGSAIVSTHERAIAQPDAIFRPIVSQIESAAPVGWKVRLPAAIKLTGYEGKVIKLYGVSEGFSNSTFRVALNSQPNCQARACMVGFLSSQRGNGGFDDSLSEPILSKADLSKIRAIRQRSYQTWTDADRALMQKGEGAILERSAVDLGSGIKGTFIVRNGMGASTPPRLVLTWKQDRQIYTVSWGAALQDGQVTSTKRQEIVGVARSMVSENPIAGKASFY